MKKEDEIRVERKFQQAVADMGMTQQQFSDRSSYWNYLQDELIVKQNCSNQFAGVANKHVRLIAYTLRQWRRLWMKNMGGAMENNTVYILRIS